MRVAAVGDLHCVRAAAGRFRALFEAMSDSADVLALCGDLTDTGDAAEAAVLARELGAATKPVLAVLGNHDHECGRQDEVRRILTDAGAEILEGTAWQSGEVGIAGAKGFGGGFGQRALEPWGEEAVKHFVRESVDEALKLESALARLRTAHRLALLHYAPISATVEGESREVFPFLGSTRLEEPIDRYRVGAVFHGHAHHGQRVGRTRGGALVFNVSLPLLKALHGGAQPFLVVEVGEAGITELTAAA